ncbi:TraR/DksA C4-type zinc finger protein [Ferruginibacter lapsinanis]|uniref:TraR/DksA family transcriptional regulator n=1 Tax=Ferruginibacter lapsinanis TaxID=563172 RepID=UPI001E2CA901|nr:TraR/DksA C4-type zinc finger protein [Ferruginibacter lapsinanis]UEG50400.1 TraR/DksA C4-type zinc finger protein [Ferruginibacter lapsinanis]
MATKKKVAAKPAAKKTAKPIKKAVPVKKVAPKKAAKPTPKKVAKPTPKSAKPLPKKVAPKKAAPAPAKKAAAPAPKKVTVVKKSPEKAAPKPMTKKVEAKATPKPAAPAKVTAPVKAKDIKVPAPKPVVIPKISTKTVRTYQPDFTKSVLDKAPKDPGAPSQRYSDPELAEFKELILRKLEAAKKELSYLHGLITRKDEMGGDDTDNRYMTMEDGSLSMEREQLSQMASRQITFIDHLEKAIMRIENKTYGICRVTGKLIDKARLRAVPHATLSIEAKMGAVK